MKLTIDDVKRDPRYMNEFIHQHASIIYNSIRKNFPDLYLANDYEDIVQTANISLFKAIERFDTNNGAKFETYAISCIIGGTRTYLRDNDLKIGLTITNKMRLNYRKQGYLLSTGKTVEQIAEQLDVSINDLTELTKTMNAVVCLDQPISNNDDGAERTISDTVHDGVNLANDLVTSMIIDNKKDLIKKHLSYKHYRLLTYTLEGFTKKEICHKLKLKQIKYYQMVEELMLGLKYLNEYFEIGGNLRPVVIMLKGIITADVKPPIINELLSIETIKKWAKKNPGKGIKVAEILAGIDFNGSKQSVKTKAIEELRFEGYIVTQNGTSFKLEGIPWPELKQ